MGFAAAGLNVAGEHLMFGIKGMPPVRWRVAAFLKSCGPRLDGQHNVRQAADRKRLVTVDTACTIP